MKVTDFIKKNKILLAILVGIFVAGIFFRTYHFSDWLHFELDQSRDAKIIDLAITEGIQNLPLLGPKAAGSFLRLGPIFYYFNYLSALVFGNTPSGVAFIMAIFGILSIPAFFLFSKRYFEKWTALLLTAIFSFSLFLIIYSRFSWNPNALPLFILLTFYFLLRAVDVQEKNKGRWLLGASFFLAIVTQLHFLSFVLIPAVVIIFIAIKRPKIRFYYWIGAILIIVLLNFPVILNEVKTGGKNFSEFKKVVMGKTNKDSEKTLIEKIIRNYTENSIGHFLIISSLNGEIPRFQQKPNFDIQCTQTCRDRLLNGLVALFIFSLGNILLIKNLLKEKEDKKKDFLLLSLVWVILAFGLFIPLSFDISPRFWLIVSALPFVYLGFIFEFFKSLFSRKAYIFFMLMVTLLFIGSNSYSTFQRFNELRNASISSDPIGADRILKEKMRVTLEQQKLIIDHINNIYQKNNFPVYLNSDPQYRRSFLFLLDKLEIPREDLRNSEGEKKVYQNGNYFLIYPTLSNWQKDLDKYSKIYMLSNQKQFGTLTVFEIKPKLESINAIQEEITPRGKTKSAPGVPERYTWEEIFNETNGEEGE